MPDTMEFTDQLGRQVVLHTFPPRRIVSLVPSQTELLADLGLEEEVVGITKFCVHPGRWFRTKTRVGGTKKLHLDRIEALQPDLVLANKEENERGQIEALAARFPVWVSDVANLEDALDMIRRVGDLTGKRRPAEDLARRIREGFARLRDASSQAPPLRVAYFIWRQPWMVAGGDTFIHSVLEAAGFCNVFAERQRYPEVTMEEVAQAAPDVLLLSSEPFPFGEKHVHELAELLPHIPAVLVDGQLCSWYGSRLLYTPDYLGALHQRLVGRAS